MEDKITITTIFRHSCTLTLLMVINSNENILKILKKIFGEKMMTKTQQSANKKQQMDFSCQFIRILNNQINLWSYVLSFQKEIANKIILIAGGSVRNVPL